MPDFVQTVIIGAGPAGLSCALQLSRYGLKYKLYEKNRIGGLLNNANLVENYLGISPPLSGVDLIEKFRKQIDLNSVDIDFDEVQNVNFELCFNRFVVKNAKQTLNCNNLVIATGTKAKIPDFNIEESAKDYVKYEVSDILEYLNKDILIIGSGDAAFDYALNLAKSNKVKILARSEKLSALPLLIDRARKNSNIEIIKNERVNNIRYDCSLIIQSDNKQYNADFALVAIGREPEDSLLSEISNKEALINNKRLFLIGDVINGIYRQASISAAQGLQTAMEIYLNQMEKQV